MGDFKIIHGDAVEEMRRFRHRVAHVITDPPYSKALYARTRTNKGHGKRPNGQPVSKGCLDGSASSIALASEAIGAIDDILDDCAALFLELTERWIIAFHDFETHGWRLAFGESYVRTGAWVKSNPMPQISADRPAAGFEPCTIAYGIQSGRMRWNGGGRAAVWTHANCQGPERPDHPCPKPLALMEDLVRDFTDPGDLVLDPFCGSGTTGLACVRLGRRFIGIDRNEKFAAMAEARCAGTYLPDRAGQASIFDLMLPPPPEPKPQPPEPSPPDFSLNEG